MNGNGSDACHLQRRHDRAVDTSKHDGRPPEEDTLDPNRFANQSIYVYFRFEVSDLLRTSTTHNVPEGWRLTARYGDDRKCLKVRLGKHDLDGYGDPLFDFVTDGAYQDSMVRYPSVESVCRYLYDSIESVPGDWPARIGLDGPDDLSLYRYRSNTPLRGRVDTRTLRLFEVDRCET